VVEKIAEFQEKPDSVFLDKIKLSALIVDKEGQLAGSYATLIKKLKQGSIEPSNLVESSDYHNCWRLMHELYTFMKHNEIAEHKAEHQEEHETLKNIFCTYEKLDSIMSFEQLKQALDILTKIISMAGYHNTTFQTEDDFENEE
jgi:hypothetical protein